MITTRRIRPVFLFSPGASFSLSSFYKSPAVYRNLSVLKTFSFFRISFLHGQKPVFFCPGIPVPAHPSGGPAVLPFFPASLKSYPQTGQIPFLNFSSQIGHFLYFILFLTLDCSELQYSVFSQHISHFNILRNTVIDILLFFFCQRTLYLWQGLPNTSIPSGISTFCVTRLPAPIKHPFPIFAPSIMMDPIPISVWSPISHPWMTAL